MRRGDNSTSHAAQKRLAREKVGNTGKVGTSLVVTRAHRTKVVGRVGPAGCSPPYQQGQLDGLCGLYSAVNAIVLLLGRVVPLGDEQISRLFDQGIAIISATGELASTVTGGVDHRVWRRLVGRLAAAAALASGCGIRVSRLDRGRQPAAWPSVCTKLESTLEANGVVTLMLCGTHHHYSVIQSHTRTRYRLFDSSGLCWLAKGTCGPPNSDARHRFATASILLLELV